MAAYLGERWKARLTLITVVDPGHVDDAVQAEARQYLEMHELAADYIVATGNGPEQILNVAQERACDALLMGRHNYSPLVEGQPSMEECE